MRMQSILRTTQLFSRVAVGNMMVVLSLFVLYLLTDAQGASSDSLRIVLLLLVWSGASLASGAFVVVLTNCALAIGLRRPVRLLIALCWLLAAVVSAALAIAAEVVRTLSGPVS